MRNVAGLSTSEAQKSSDMFGKCRYLDEITGGRGVVFATGTPVSNSMTELYTVMRYLQYSTLQQKKLTHFDCWASTFGETTTAIELAPEGTGYRARTRFAKFFNLPELMSMFKEVADIKLATSFICRCRSQSLKPWWQSVRNSKGNGAGTEQTCRRYPLRHRGCVRGQYALRHQRWAQDWLGRSPDEPHAARRPQQQAERMRSECAEDLGGRQRPEVDPAFILRPLDTEKRWQFQRLR